MDKHAVPDIFQNVPYGQRRIKVLEDRPADGLFDVDIGGYQQILFVIVIDIQGGRRHIGRLGDLGYRGGGEPDFIHRLDCGFEQGRLFLFVLRSHKTKINDHSFKIKGQI